MLLLENDEAGGVGGPMLGWLCFSGFLTSWRQVTFISASFQLAILMVLDPLSPGTGPSEIFQCNIPALITGSVHPPSAIQSQ